MSKLTKRKDGRYQTSVYIGVVDGKKKNIVVYGKTQRECKENAAAVKQKLNKGIDITAERNTWADWVNAWRAHVMSTKSKRQQSDDEYYLKHYDCFNNIPLIKLNVSDFQNIINQLYKQNPHTLKPTAKSTLIKIKSIAKQVLEYAITNRAVDFNPVQYVQIPKTAPKKNRRELTEQEVSWIENFPHRAQLPAMIMLYSGLRPSECFALQWKDIDFKNKTIDVNKTLEMKQRPPRTKPTTKTEDGLRLVDIPQKLVDFLKPYKRGPFDYVLLNTKGQLYTDSCWRSLWDSYLINLNYEYGDFSLYIDKPKSKYQPKKIPMVIDAITPYYLRHTHATDLFDAGCNIFYVKDQMGHKDIKTTLKTYIHYTKRNKNANSNKLDDFLTTNSSHSQGHSQASQGLA